MSIRYEFSSFMKSRGREFPLVVLIIAFPLIIVVLAIIDVFVPYNILGTPPVPTLIGAFIAIAMALWVYKSQRMHYYQDKILDLRAELARNFRFMPSLPVFQDWQLLGSGCHLPTDVKQISNLAASCSMNQVLRLSDVMNQDNMAEDKYFGEVPSPLKGGILVWCISRLRVYDPSVTINWVEGKIEYRPDIESMSNDELLSWARRYQSVMTGLEFAWTVNRSNVESLVVEFVNSQEYARLSAHDSTFKDLEAKVEGFFSAMYGNLKVISEIERYITRI